VHHRVKNNLQVISSLLALQSDAVPDAGTRALLTESQNRVQAMAIIHEKLYQSSDLARVDFGDYVKSLTGFLFRCYSNAAGRVVLRVVADDVHLNIDTAVPCGLILNELVSNALKHAFKDGRTGDLRVELLANAEGCSITIADNGVGLPANFDLKQTSSLGLQLVDTLAKQLKGTLTIRSEGGTSFCLDFKELVFPNRERPRETRAGAEGSWNDLKPPEEPA
jgi:two-component sensor histidine kinase